MVILRILYTLIAIISLGSVDAVQLLNRVRPVHAIVFSKKMIAPVIARSLFYKADANGVKKAIFNDACCKQKYYVKDGKAHRLGDEALPLAEDIVFGWKMSIIDGKAILKTNPVPEEDKPRIRYLKNILMPYDMFPVIGFDPKDIQLFNGRAQSQVHYITLSADMREIVDGILAKKEILTLGVDENLKYSLSLELAEMVVKFYMLHESGHIYHQHHIVRDNLVPYQHEREADAFATQTFEGIVGGIITSKMKNEVMLNTFNTMNEIVHKMTELANEMSNIFNHSGKTSSVKQKPLQEKKMSFEDLKVLYFSTISKSTKPVHKQHPSWIEREYFFREALEKFLQENPSYCPQYEALKDHLKTDYKILVR